MSMKLRHILLFGLFLATILNGNAQLFPQYSQYMFTPMTFNPGATGAEEALSAYIANRSMWKGIEGAPRLQHGAVQTPLRNDRLAAGILFSKDQIGVSAMTGFGLSGAYRLKLGKGKLSFGLQTRIYSYTNSWSDVVTTQANDAAFNTGDQSSWLMNVGSGLYYFTPKYFAGISVPQMLTPEYAGGGKYASTGDLSKFTYHLNGGYTWDLPNNLQLSASSLIRINKYSPAQIDVSALLKWKQYFDAGLTYRAGDAWVMIARVYIKPQISIAYSYDKFTSSLGKYDRGTHEFSLLYSFRYLSQSPSPKLF